MASGRRIMPKDLNVTITAFVEKMHGNNSYRDWSRQPQENSGIASSPVSPPENSISSTPQSSGSENSQRSDRLSVQFSF